MVIAGEAPNLGTPSSILTAVAVGGLFGLTCALFGETLQRVFYAHGDTHVDPACSRHRLLDRADLGAGFARLLPAAWVPIR